MNNLYDAVFGLGKKDDGAEQRQVARRCSSWQSEQQVKSTGRELVPQEHNSTDDRFHLYHHVWIGIRHDVVNNAGVQAIEVGEGGMFVVAELIQHNL